MRKHKWLIVAVLFTGVVLLIGISYLSLGRFGMVSRDLEIREIDPDTVQAIPPDKIPKGTEVLDRMLDEMADANIAFNMPDSVMNVGDSREVQLVIDLTKNSEQLRSLISEPGNIETHQIKVTSAMEATLTGEGFKIEAITPETQPISARNPNEWRWHAKAVEAGDHRLHLVINALVEIDGSKMRRSIKTFEKDIDVRVSFGNVLANFIGKNWQWLMGTIAIPLFLYYWNSRRKKRPPVSKKKGH